LLQFDSFLDSFDSFTDFGDLLGNFSDFGDFSNLLDGLDILDGFSDFGTLLGDFGDFTEFTNLFNGVDIGSLTGAFGDFGFDDISDLTDQFGGELVGDFLGNVGIGDLGEFTELNGIEGLEEIFDLGSFAEGFPADLSVEGLLDGNVDFLDVQDPVGSIGSAFGYGGNQGEHPFGGTITGPFIPCILCGLTGFIVGSVQAIPGGIPFNGNLYYDFFDSRLYPRYRPFPGHLTLGLHDNTSTSECRVGFPPFVPCFIIPAQATINIIGTD